MTDLPDAVRSAALALPEAEERPDGFYVAGRAFVRVTDDEASILAGDDWVPLPRDGGMVEDRIAASWELAAPRRLLEAGGR